MSHWNAIRPRDNGDRMSPGSVSNLSKKICAKIDEWRHRRIEGQHPYVFLDGIVIKRSWAGEVRNVSLLVAIGVTMDGYREILGIVEGPKEDRSGWSIFLRHFADRGLSGAAPPRSCPTRSGSAVSCISIATSSASLRPARSATSRRC